MRRRASFILTKDNVYWSKNTDRHEDILNEYKLHDTFEGKAQVLRVEIVPPVGDLSSDVKDWEFRYNQDVLPDWADCEKDESRTRRALASWHRQKVVLGKVDVLDAGQYYVGGTAVIRSVRGSAEIGFVEGSAKIRSVRGSAEIGFVRGSAKISSVEGNATIGYVGGDAEIEYVGGNATIKYVEGDAEIGYIKGSAEIGYIKGPAEIESASSSPRPCSMPIYQLTPDGKWPCSVCSPEGHGFDLAFETEADFLSLLDSLKECANEPEGLSAHLQHTTEVLASNKEMTR